MKISSKGKYALCMLLDLAEHKADGFIPLKVIAHRQRISKQYLEQIVTLLHASDFLRTNRGNQGGYKLAGEPSQYTVGQILRITEGNLAPVSCLEDATNQCEQVSYCKTIRMWEGLNKVIADYIDSVTLQDMLDEYAEAGADNYMI